MSPKKHRIALITDSTCNIPASLVKAHDIVVAPAHIIWGMEDKLDLVDVTPQQFYDQLTKSPTQPTTSQPSPLEFAKVIDSAKNNGAQEAVICAISSALSGTVRSAQQAAQAAGIPVRVYDSLSVGMGLGWQVLAVARAREAGGDSDAMIEAASHVRERVVMMLVVGTLDYLHRGGRIGGAQMLVGTALDIKPRLVVNPKTGKVEVGDRVRTRKKAVESMYTNFFKAMDLNKTLHISVHHVAAPDECRALFERISADYKPAELLLEELTPVLGVHAGPGTLGIAGYYE